MLTSKLILLFLLLAVVVKGSLDYRNSHKRGVAFYGYDWDDHSYGGGDMEDGDLEEEPSMEEEGGKEWMEEDEDWKKEEEEEEEEEDDEGEGEEDWTWKKADENTYHDDMEEADVSSHHHYKHKQNYPKPKPKPKHYPPPHHHPHRPIVKVDIITRPRPHRGNFKDGYANGFNAGMNAPFNRDHTIEYLHTVTSCEIHKRVDIIDGVRYTFSSLSTVTGPITVTKTMVDFDGKIIEISLTNGKDQLATLPMEGVTRTVVGVEDELTTLPIRSRWRQRQPPSDQRQFMQELPPAEQRLGLDGANGWGKVLAVGDDGIRGTVLKNIVYDENGDAIIPTRAGTRQVYVINDKTTTLKDGKPTPFPADNGHTRTVIALRNGMVTLPLTGADEFTKLLPIDGITETVAVFDDLTYTLKPDQTDSSGHVMHQTIPSQIMRTVVVEEILNNNSAPVKSSAFGFQELLMEEAARPNIYTLPADLSLAAPSIAPPEPSLSSLGLPVSTTPITLPEPSTSLSSLPVSTIPIVPPEPKTSALNLPLVTSSSITPPAASLSGLLSSLFRAPLNPIPSRSPPPATHCPTKLVLDSKRKSEGCYALAGLNVIDSEMRQVESQGHWTDQDCHSFCESSPRRTNTTTTWYYGLTLSTDGGSSTCRCMLDFTGTHPSTHCRIAPGSLQQRSYHLGEVAGDSDDDAVYIYQASYRCLSPSLLKRRRLDEIPACRTTEVASKRASEGCYPYLAPKVSVSQARRWGQDNWTAATCYSFCVESGRVPMRTPWYYGLTTTTSMDDTTCFCMLEMGASPTETHCVALNDGNTTAAATTQAGVVDPDDLSAAAMYAYKVAYQCPGCTAPKQIGNTMATEGCYGLADYAAHVVKKITRDLEPNGVFSPKECFDLCANSGLVVPGQAWWYGISQTDPGAAAYHGLTSTTSCRCSVQAPRSSVVGSARCHHSVGFVDDRFLYRIHNGIYVYKVDYQC